MTPTDEARAALRWSAFEDEDHAWMAVDANGDYVWWPEMAEDDVRRVVSQHDAFLDALIAAVRAEHQAKLAALRPYLDHYAKCPTSTAGIPKSQCTCGLVAVLDATEAER